MTQDVPDAHASFTLEDVVPRTFAARGEMVEAKKWTVLSFTNLQR